MDWVMVGKPVSKKITKPLAIEWASMRPVPHDRPLSERRIEIYLAAVAAGNFRTCNWAKAVCAETGETYRVNGKHTSTMLSTLDELPELHVTIEAYKCEHLDGLAKLYATFDSRIQGRSIGDIYRTFAASNPELAAMPKGNISVLVSGLGYARWLELSYNKQPAERAELLLDNVEFAHWYCELVPHNNLHRQLIRGPVVAAMYHTFQKSKKDATVFWQAVRDETGATPDMPDRVLGRWLLVSSVNHGAGSRRLLHKSQPREFYVRCIHGWNAWRKGETTNLKYLPSGQPPKVL